MQVAEGARQPSRLAATRPSALQADDVDARPPEGIRGSEADDPRPHDANVRRDLALELGEKVEDFIEAPPMAVPGGAEAALKALERLGYGVPEADRAIRQALAGNGTETETETLVRRALQILTTR